MTDNTWTRDSQGVLRRHNEPALRDLPHFGQDPACPRCVAVLERLDAEMALDEPERPSEELLRAALERLAYGSYAGNGKAKIPAYDP